MKQKRSIKEERRPQVTHKSLEGSPPEGKLYLFCECKAELEDGNYRENHFTQ